MSRLERLGALHADVRVPVASVTSVRSVPRAIDEIRGIRAPGTGVPGAVMIGTTRGDFGRDFCVVRGRGPGIVITLSNAPFQRVVVSADDAASEAARLQGALASST